MLRSGQTSEAARGADTECALVTETHGGRQFGSATACVIGKLTPRQAIHFQI